MSNERLVQLINLLRTDYTRTLAHKKRSRTHSPTHFIAFLTFLNFPYQLSAVSEIGNGGNSRTDKGYWLTSFFSPPGSQPLDVVWTKDGSELVDCSDFKYTDYGEGSYGLRFLDTFTEDSGVYTCEAYNEHGDATTSTTLEIGGKYLGTENRRSVKSFP